MITILSLILNVSIIVSVLSINYDLSVSYNNMLDAIQTKHRQAYLSHSGFLESETFSAALKFKKNKVKLTNHWWKIWIEQRIGQANQSEEEMWLRKEGREEGRVKVACGLVWKIYMELVPHPASQGRPHEEKRMKGDPKDEEEDWATFDNKQKKVSMSPCEGTEDWISQVSHAGC